jgi:hypothetical protein
VTTLPAKAESFCAVQTPWLQQELLRLRTLHPATLAPEGPIQAQDHPTTRMFYGRNDRSGFAGFLPPTLRNILFSKALARPRYHGRRGQSNRARLTA